MINSVQWFWWLIRTVQAMQCHVHNIIPFGVHTAVHNHSHWVCGCNYVPRRELYIYACIKYKYTFSWWCSSIDWWCGKIYFIWWTALMAANCVAWSHGDGISCHVLNWWDVHFVLCSIDWLCLVTRSYHHLKPNREEPRMVQSPPCSCCWWRHRWSDGYDCAWWHT